MAQTLVNGSFCHLSSVRPSTWPLYCEIVMKRLLSKWPLKASITDSNTIVAGGHFS
jgi:hypothetical protein